MDSSIDVLVPSIAPLIDQWYGATPGAIDGMPPHITLLWPWVPAPVSEDDIERARRAVAGVARFTLTLRTTARFPGVLYLVPEPSTPFEELIGRVSAAFPETPPYGGQFGPAPLPHLTVAMDSDEAALDVVERTLRTRLDHPHVIDVDHLSISEHRPGGRWAVRSHVPLVG